MVGIYIFFFKKPLYTFTLEDKWLLQIIKNGSQDKKSVFSFLRIRFFHFLPIQPLRFWQGCVAYRRRSL